MIGIGLAEAGFLPDWIIRLGIRSMLRDRAARAGYSPIRKRHS